MIDDDANCGADVLTAVRTLPASDGEARSKRQVVAIAVRERPTKKFCKVLRFLYSVPPHMSNEIGTWIAVPKSETTSNLLFSNRDDNGEVVAADLASDLDKCTMGHYLLQRCNVKTIAQRCADWFLLRQFRVTGTSAGELLMDDSAVLETLGIVEDERDDLDPATVLKIGGFLVQQCKV